MDEKNAYGYSQKTQLYPEMPQQSVQYQHYPLQVASVAIPVQLRSKPLIKSCCCFTLRTASLILGWLNLNLNIITLIMISVMGPAILGAMTTEMKKDPEFDEVNHEVVDAILTTAGIIIIMVYVVLIFADALLLLGIYKKKPILLKTFLILFGILFVLGAMGVMNSAASGYQTPLRTFEQIGSLCWSALSLLVVFSYHRELQIELNTKAITNASPPMYEP